MNFLQQLDALKLSLKTPWRGLEVGCGNGILRNQIEQNSHWTVDGADINLRGLEANQSRRGKVYLYDVLDRDTRFRESYDFVLLYDVVEHVRNTREFLESCVFHLKPDGYLFVNVPALGFLWSAYDEAQGHLRRYSKKTLQEEFESARLDLLDIRFWGMILVPLLLLRKVYVSASREPGQIIEKGFKPPASFINEFLKVIMTVETRLWKRPPLGTSLMAVGIKRKIAHT